ncbi:sigma-70 family RNA polymerase sigma factor [uncultured Muribaculum sp.]|uniref:sigma-70 family RNA polymerase sigma factor n=1 Tax=uncultured Muribaculum sp. TaxID=1918613 RepID=UPI002670291E|nr:sigma-70 family RNA polymerase sigma factor [uncultured Muribaculum sp.]
MTKEELVNLCKEGDEQALSLLYKTYAKKMKRICRRYVSDEQTVNDLLHDGFIIIFTSISTLRSSEKLESWMGKIMKNISLKYLEQCLTITNIPLDCIEEFEEPLIPSYSTNFPSYAIMLKMVESLPKGYCKIFKLAVLEGLSHKEIGILLNIAPHSSSSQLSRAKELLRKLLSQYYIAVGLFVLLSVIYLRHLLYAPKEIAGTSPKTVINPQEEQELENISLEDTINVTPVRISARQYTDFQSTKKDMCGQDIANQENVVEQKDSSQLSNNPITKEQEFEEDKNTHYTIIPQFSPHNKKKWSLALSYSGVNKQTNIQKTIIPGDISSEKPQEVIKESYHHIPIILSLSFSKKFNECWWLETGFQYTHLHSDFTTITDSYLKEVQKINYIGIPLKGIFNVHSKQRLSIYLSTGVTLDIPVKATSESIASNENGQITFCGKSDIHPSLQWSTNLGIGIQYHITPSVGIYAEPNLHYYFNNGDRIKTIRTEKSFNVTLPIGFRLSW